MNSTASRPLPTHDLLGPVVEVRLQTVRRYFSGAGCPAIFGGYSDAGVPVCLVAADLSRSLEAEVTAYLRDGGQLLLDSGAFIHRGRPGHLNWDRILGVYARLASIGDCECVLPDVVGDQAATLDLLERTASQTRRLFAAGARFLLAVQRGELPLDAFYRRAVEVLGFEPEGLALPSHSAALPPSSLAQLAGLQRAPRRIHLLGVSRNTARLGGRALRLLDLFPDADISADACEHRAQVGTGQPITQDRARWLRDMVDEDLLMHDDTEDEGVDASVVAALRCQFPAADDDTINDMVCSSWGGVLATAAFRRRQEGVRGPAATRASIRAFALRRSGALGGAGAML